MKWNLFADGSVDSDRGQKKPLIPGGWACILQAADGTEEEILCQGYKMTPPRIQRMEMMAVIKGLQLTSAKDVVQIFSDNWQVLGGILIKITRENLAQILESMEPLERRSYRRILRATIDKPGREVDLLTELEPLLLQREIRVTIVSNMKIDSGQQAFPAHERCHVIAQEQRRFLAASLGFLRPEEKTLIRWPYTPRKPE